MTNEELLQATLNSTIERISKQAASYEAEIANLNAQIIILNDTVKKLSEEQNQDDS